MHQAKYRHHPAEDASSYHTILQGFSSTQNNYVLICDVIRYTVISGLDLASAALVDCL